MIVALAALTALSVAAMVLQSRQHGALVTRLVEASAAERMLLVAAVQHPQLPTPQFVSPGTLKAAVDAQAETAEPRDEWHLVGTVAPGSDS